MLKQCVNIVLVNYNGYQDTIECIDSIFKSNYLKYNIIVVDNNSTNESINELENNFKIKKYFFYTINYDFNEKKFMESNIEITNKSRNVILIKSNYNGGFGYANNLGFKFSKEYLNSEYCWILNNDVTIEPNTIDILIKKIEDIGTNVFLGSTIIEYYDKQIIGRIAGNMYYPFFGYVKPYNAKKKLEELNQLKAKFNYLSGCSIFTYFSNIYLIDGFDEDFFLYAEDIDICKRAEKKGIKLVWCKDAYVYHKGGSSIGTANIKRKRSHFSEYYSNLSILIYNKKWYKLANIFNFNRYILKSVKFIIEGDFDMFKPLNKAYKDFKQMKRS